VSQQDRNTFPLISINNIKINNIKIGKRFRNDLGDITSFAKEIEEIGLLHPIVINQNQELICGLRRIEAFKELGRTEIPAHIVNMEEILKGEISENVQRKDFSWEEIIEIKKTIEPEIRKEAEKECMQENPQQILLRVPTTIALFLKIIAMTRPGLK
jgi:ParB family chromosome partitioning protein